MSTESGQLQTSRHHVRMFDNPAFIEDIVRAVVADLMADERVDWFLVKVVSFESIHNHNAFAKNEWTRLGQANI